MKTHSILSVAFEVMDMSLKNQFIHLSIQSSRNDTYCEEVSMKVGKYSNDYGCTF